MQKRLFIYANDLMEITGKSERTCRRLLAKIKAHFGRDQKQELTFQQLSEFFSIPLDQILNHLRMYPILIAASTAST